MGSVGMSFYDQLDADANLKPEYTPSLEHLWRI